MHERVKDNMYLPFLLFISVTANSTIQFFFVSFQMRHEVSFRRLYETILGIGCIVAFRTFHLLVEHMVRGIGSTILHLKSKYHMGNDVSFPFFRHSTRCGLIFLLS